MVPAGNLRYRISKDGLETVEGYTASAVTGNVGVTVNVKLYAQGNAPAGMVRVAWPKPIGEFWLDKYEVTNRRFKEFVDRGGYQKADYWRSFAGEGRTIDGERARAGFTDATGRPGPATWRYGSFPTGHEDDPVGGVSWFEAGAYCAFVGKSLPTVHHWRAASLQPLFATILLTSNFSGIGPHPVGVHGGLGPFGTYDTAGNVREWCLNASGDKRYVLGGAWDDPKYLFYMPDSRSPFDRSAGNGIRCAKLEQDPAPELTGALDYSPLAGGQDATPADEAVTAYLYLPKNAVPPFEGVVTFPGTYAFDIPSSAKLETQWFDFFVRSGRAVMHPVYKGTYERTIGGNFSTYMAQPAVFRDLAIDWFKDLGRSLDYLETRPEIDAQRLAYHGISVGAAQGPRFMALEPRLKAGVLFWGGLGWASPEVNSRNYARRCTTPTLMINGRADLIFPLERSQVPLFRLLGSPDGDKRHVVPEDAGHLAFNREVVRQALGWLDKYLGPVTTR
jgi:dienelactone hydrolase